MKKILAIVVSTGFLIACNTGNDKIKPSATEPAIENHDSHSEQVNGLTLNNGTKWKADSTTVLNVDLLQKIVSGAGKASLENYKETATGLENGLKKMVSECKMKGADHEALHHWLEPLMAKTKELKSANDNGNANAILGDIEKKINLFPQYFEG